VARRHADGFKFAVKASRFCVNRKKLTDGASRSASSEPGPDRAGRPAGPILWQFMATKKFDYDDFAGFIDLLPRSSDGLPLQHVIEVRNATFADPKFVGLCRDRGVTICNSENENYPIIPDITGDLVYLRLISASDEIPTGYEAKDLDLWAGRFKAYAEGACPATSRPSTAPARRRPARRLRLRHPRGEGARPGRGHGVHQAGGPANAC
jgi:uncharacterized protein YecE (DUF72 family)